MNSIYILGNYMDFLSPENNKTTVVFHSLHGVNSLIDMT